MGDIPYEVLQQGGWVGPRFRGVFFFRDVFWRVVVPLVWGTRSINALDGLAVMPAQIKQRLVSVPKTRDEYLLQHFLRDIAHHFNLTDYSPRKPKVSA